jgi:hypothetical protein
VRAFNWIAISVAMSTGLTTQGLAVRCSKLKDRLIREFQHVALAEVGLCCTNRLEVGPPPPLNEFTLQPQFWVCQAP